MQRCNNSNSTGKIYVVGTGPGTSKMITPACKEAIYNSDVITGYKTYLSLVSDFTQGKCIICSGMRHEVERAEASIRKAVEGNTVTVISGGDPGVYGMAGLVFEVCRAESVWVPVEVIPGITAANSGAALLGAPLSCDYCVLSLSNLLVDEDRILKRAEGAASAGFVTVLYNPVSKRRRDLINKVRDIFLKHLDPETPVGIIRNIAREGESRLITRLDRFTQENIDMVTTVFIGNADTFVWEERMAVIRGYKL